jgi:chemotaxis protein CheX
MSRIKSEDIKIFSDAASAFFYQTTGVRAKVRTAYMLSDSEKIHWNDYQSRIDLGGQYLGMVAFSAPRAMLTNILLRLGENDYSEANHLDVTGEIANQMSGYVRRHFGEGMNISPPKAVGVNDSFVDTGVDTGIDVHSFVIPMTWDNYEAKLYVKIKKLT